MNERIMDLESVFLVNRNFTISDIELGCSILKIMNDNYTP